MDARDVAGCGDDAPRSAADDHRPVGEFRPVALLDSGIERVAVDMGDGQRVKLRMPEKARAAAGTATLRLAPDE